MSPGSNDGQSSRAGFFCPYGTGSGTTPISTHRCAASRTGDGAVVGFRRGGRRAMLLTEAGAFCENFT
jgi:hypothetical protein